MWTRIFASVVLVGGVACGGGGGGGPDAATGCNVDGDCPATAPACNLDNHTCVECTDTNVMACDGPTPTCNSDNTCSQTCSADEDCDSGACLADGSCAETNRVLYVTADAATGDCTKADKCNFGTALTLVDATKNVIHLDPMTYTFATGFDLVGVFAITGIGARFIVAANQDVFRIRSGDDITLDFFTFGGSDVTPTGEAIDCVNGTLKLRKVTVGFTAGVAIESSACGLRIERSIIHDGAIGGIEIGGATPFALFDNVIHHNGDGTNVGGVRLLGSTADGSRLEFNTIVDNASGPNGGIPAAGGVACSNNQVFAAANNLIVRNSAGGVTSPTTQTAGPCTYPTSIVTDDITAIKFASPDQAPLSYKITAGSSAIDQGTTQSAVKIDFEGDARPQGAASDIGADELK